MPMLVNQNQVVLFSKGQEGIPVNSVPATCEYRLDFRSCD